MRRREFIFALSGTVAVWPLAARAQQPALPVIGFIRTTSPEDSAPYLEAFRKGLGETGFVEGRNVTIEYRYAHDQFDRLPMLAAELVQKRVAVLVATGGTVAARAAKAATSSIPVVFTTGDDPVRVGLVASLSRPGGNVTGIAVFTSRIGSKRLGLLHELIPSVSNIGMLVYPDNPDSIDETPDVLAAAGALGVHVRVLNARNESEIDAAFADFVRRGVQAVMIGSDAFLSSRRMQIIALAARYSLPAMYGNRLDAAAGGLISYGSSIPGVYRQAGVYAGRILKGEKPADLPVQLPTGFELVLNLKTAKALGLEVPLGVSAGADEVIE
jgi:putative tryptophan/tyrosine transport system substrate-binding protein